MQRNRLQRSMSALAAVITVAAGAATSPASAQGIPVIDQTSIVNQLRELAQMADQLATMKSQLDEAVRMYGTVTGIRNLDDVLQVAGAQQNREYLPSSMTDAIGILRGASGSDPTNLSGIAGTLRKASDFLSDEQKGQLTEQQRQAYEAGLDATVFQGTFGQAAYDQASQRMGYLNQQVGSIKSAVDPKGIAEIQAAMAAQTNYLLNESIRLMSLSQMAEAKKDQARMQHDAVVKGMGGGDIPAIDW